MNFIGLKYSTSINVGDYIQSIATEQFTPPVKYRFDRDFLGEIGNKRKKNILITNGWFSHYPKQCFPFSSTIIPLFFGLHITNWNDCWEYILTKPVLDFFKNNEPIGCRDQYTANRLKENGIDAYYSKCLTLTLPRRDITPRKNKYVIMDASRFQLPDSIRKKSEHFTQHFPENCSEREKFAIANQLLKYYRQKASAVITTRLHCALPCLAIGIPVIFIGNPDDYRLSILKDIGIKINTHEEIAQLTHWDDLFQTIDFGHIENIKNEIILDINNRISQIQEFYSS